jgi:uncharacterized coiled-coil protein SlyX
MGSTEGEPTVHARIEELEVHAAFQARTIEELDLVLREFSVRVERLERELRELRAQLESDDAASPSAAAEDAVVAPSNDDSGELGDERDVG